VVQRRNRPTRPCHQPPERSSPPPMPPTTPTITTATSTQRTAPGRSPGVALAASVAGSCVVPAGPPWNVGFVAAPAGVGVPAAVGVEPPAPPGSVVGVVPD